MVHFTIDLKINMYVAISLMRQPQQNKQETKEENSAVADSGCTGNFMAVSAHLNNLQPTTKIINRTFPKVQIIRSTVEIELYLPIQRSKSRQAHIFPNIKHSLVSIGELCDAVCIVTFRIKYITLMYKNNIILRGWRNHQNKLWYFQLAI